ncbi:response regulator [Flavobacterium sp. MAH-1]|uniref:Response regulator n=1 Tax=Flavobacterium agri TaxID=2743471 RepID=A0A7Y8Y1S4_9FLAO|nr:response regulator [Flavobacterium agri]NUY81015.1 response regulator [Flavobacterium agri]NYA71039.1 response regulator [Flavobacterium agri]
MKNENPIFEVVMVIDDNPIDLYVATRLIKKMELADKLLEFSSAQKALDYLRDNQDDSHAWPALMLVDIYMPGMSGFEFMAAYDKFPEDLKKKCRIFIISSSIDNTDIQKAENDPNVLSFQEKPVTPEFLSSIK